MSALCSDCPPAGYPADKTRCLPCPHRQVAVEVRTHPEALASLNTPGAGATQLERIAALMAERGVRDAFATLTAEQQARLRASTEDENFEEAPP